MALLYNKTSESLFKFFCGRVPPPSQEKSPIWEKNANPLPALKGPQSTLEFREMFIKLRHLVIFSNFNERTDIPYEHMLTIYRVATNL